MVKEYGGYLPLELPKKEEYFSFCDEKDILRLNCGRSTFFCAAKAAKVRKIFVPYLNCANSTDPFDAAGIPYEYYRLDDDLTPMDITPGEEDAVLWINYYGNAGEREKQKVLETYKTVIVDNCHAFFSKPVLRDGVYNCYSTRKFFGVVDGAYLIAKGLPSFSLKESCSAEDTLFILKTIEQGTNALYAENLKNEQRVAQKVTKMSKLTRRILSSIDYSEIQEIRFRNFCRLHRQLESINEFAVNTETKTHMYYPLLVTNDALRSHLVENRIYTPTWWRHVPDLCGNEGIETKLSRYMLMIPMDQRYDESDMDDIVTIIRKFI